MTERLNMFRRSFYSISPIFHWIGPSTQQADSFSTLIDFPDAMFQTYCNCIRPWDLRVLQEIHIHVFYVNSIITLHTLGHSDLILLIYQLKNKVTHYSMNWNTNWIFFLGRRTGFFKGYSFSPWKTNWFVPSFGRQTEFFPLENELYFSKVIPLNFFTWKTDKLNFFPWKTNLRFQTAYLWIFSLARKTKFFAYLLPLNFCPSKTIWIFQRLPILYYIIPEYFLFLRSKSNLLKSVNYWLELIPELY